MKSNNTALVGVAAVAAFLALGACNSTSTEQTAPPSPSAATAVTPQDKAHNDVDAMFAQHMIAHHQQAIEMSDMILAKQGIDPRVTELAKQIKDAQGPEIEQMKGWLTAWGGTTAAMPEPGMDMPGHSMPSTSPTPGASSGGHHGDSPGSNTMPSGSMMPSGSTMPGMNAPPGSGMMSDADMAALQNAQGVQASKLFLTQMITHHQGAIDMAHNEVNNGLYEAAVELAKSIAANQKKEIDTMNSILSSQ